MNENLIIYQENNLFGAKNPLGQVVISPKYKDMHPFSCGLSLVRNQQNQYAYINSSEELIIPFGRYNWCDPQFKCGFSRIIQKQKWGIINVLGQIIVPIQYDNINSLGDKNLMSIRANIGDRIYFLNLNELTSNIILEGLFYHQTITVEKFNEIMNISVIQVKRATKTGELYFTYGCNRGLFVGNAKSEHLVLSLVTNSNGRTFWIMHEAIDFGKTSFQHPSDPHIKPTNSDFSNHQNGQIYDEWNDPYGDTQAYNSGWSQDDVDSGLADAYEGDLDMLWNNY